MKGKIFSIGLVLLLLALAEVCCGDGQGSNGNSNGAKLIVVDSTADIADLPFSYGQGGINDLPGPDGMVTLREALTAANNTDGPVEIVVSDEIDGSTVAIQDFLPEVKKSDLVIDGLIGSQPGRKLVLDLSAIPSDGRVLWISASNVTLRNFIFQGFSFEFLEPSFRAVISVFGATPPHPAFSNVTIEDCEFKNGGGAYTIQICFGNINNVNILRNRFDITEKSRSVISIAAGTDGINDRLIKNVLIEGNDITGSIDIPIFLMGSETGGSNNELRSVKVQKNDIHQISFGIWDKQRCITVCPTAGKLLYTEKSVLRDVSFTENSCSDLTGGQAVWIVGGNSMSTEGDIINMRIERNHFYNLFICVRASKQFLPPGPGANIMEVVIEDNLIENTTWTAYIDRGTHDPSIVEKRMILDWGGGPLGSHGRNTFINSSTGFFMYDLPGWKVWAENNYWGDPSGPSDGDIANDSDGIPDPSGSGVPVGEGVYWYPFLTSPP